MNNDIAIVVANPALVAHQIHDWAHHGGVSAEVEKVPGGKYFVTLPEILTIPIELVPEA